MKKIVITAALLSTIVSCQSQASINNDNRKKALELQNQAYKLSMVFFKNRDSVLKAIKIYDQAIKTDSSFENPYLNKSVLLCELGIYTEVLDNLSKAEKLNKNDAQVIVVQAYVLEKMGKLHQATQKYIEADTVFNKLIQSKPSLIGLKLEEARLHLFLDGKTEGIKIYEKLLKSTKDPIVVESRSIFYDFNREQYIKDFCVGTPELNSGKQ